MTFPSILNPLPTFTDAKGLPITGGSIYLGVAGLDPETNPQAVYWDAAGATPASQPLTVKGGFVVNGTTPAQFFTTTPYSIRVYDAFGSVVYYKPTIGGDLSGSGGSSLVGFIQAGTSPLAKTVQSELRRSIDASQFTGFDSTGATSSTTAVQNALNLASSLGGGSVTIPTGARVLIDTQLTVPSNCHLVGPHKAVDTSVNNATTPYGTMGGVLILNSAVIILVNGGASVSGFVIHRKGMTFPAYAGASYAGDAFNLGGDGASVHTCMILGFNRAVYSRNWQRIWLANLKIDCNSGIDLRQSGDTCVIWSCEGWPFAGSRNNVDNVRTGAFIQLAGRNDWTQVINCSEYGYLRGIKLCNEADDSADIWGPANVRIVNFRSDDGWNATAPYHTGKYSVFISGDTSNETLTKARAFGVVIEGLQSSCAQVAAVYSQIEDAMSLTLLECHCWNGAQYGLLYQVSGDARIIGGECDGSGPATAAGYSSRTARGLYGVTYAVTGGTGKLYIGGGFRTIKLTTCSIRIGIATAYLTIGDVVLDPTVPAHDNTARSLRTVASASAVAVPYDVNDGEILSITGTTNIATLTGGRAGLTVTLLFSGTLTVTNATGAVDSMYLSGGANFSAGANKSLTLFHSGVQWFEKSRCS